MTKLKPSNDQLEKWSEAIKSAIRSGLKEELASVRSEIQGGSRRIDKDVYPDLAGLTFSQQDLQALIHTKIFQIKNGRQKITADALSYVIKIENPLLKLLYSQCWKINGDLGKVGNVLQGIIDFHEKKEATEFTVLYWLGRHIASDRKEPLIDQHNIRAHRFLHSINVNDKRDIREQDILKKKHAKYVKEYVKWFSQLKRKDVEYLRAVDELLMSFGQSLKIKKRKARPD